MARSEVARSEEYNAGRGISVSLGFQRLLQFFARATYVKPSQLSAGNGPLGPWQVFVLNRIREEAKNVS